MKPKVFISSTIYDFKDLRSALKYWISEMGFEAVLSESNEFNVPEDMSSYEACLKEIEHCQYFILLIGSRAGGYYDKASKKTITMAEYERAYELSLQGKIKLVSFIRRSIWDIREDRKALEDYIRNEKWISEKADVEKIAKHNSSIIQDADIVFNFIRMVTRTSDVIEAIEKKTDLPKNNWIYQFEYFEDIIKTLKTQLLLQNDLFELILLENLINELEEIVASLYYKGKDGKLISVLNIELPAYEKNNKIQHITENDIFSLFLFFGHAAGIYISSKFISEIVSIGKLLKYNIQESKFETTLAQRAAIILQDEIRKINNESFRKTFQEAFHRIVFEKRDASQGAYINPVDLLAILSYKTTLRYIFQLAKYLKNRLADKQYDNWELFKKALYREDAFYQPMINSTCFTKSEIGEMFKES